MRWTICVVTFILVAAMAQISPSDAAYGSCNCCDAHGTYGAPACMSSFPMLAPGCCKPSRRACDNAWDGYCEERAHWEAFWSRVGTGAHCWCKQTRHRIANRQCSPTEAPTCDEPVSPEAAAPETAPKAAEAVPVSQLPPKLSDSESDVELRLRAEPPIPLPPVNRAS